MTSEPMTKSERTSFIGMAVFLGGWTMLFVALLFVWADVRLSSPVWPPDGEPRAPLVYPAVATVLIAASSWMLARGRLTATAPPAGSGSAWPSQSLPLTAGLLNSCGPCSTVGMTS